MGKPELLVTERIKARIVTYEIDVIIDTKESVGRALSQGTGILAGNKNNGKH